jgi:hypothetical protein
VPRVPVVGRMFACAGAVPVRLTLRGVFHMRIDRTVVFGMTRVGVVMVFV